jgi:hypothetical protein
VIRFDLQPPDTSKLSRAAQADLAEQYERAVTPLLPQLERQVREIFRAEALESPVVRSIRGGILQAELGIEDEDDIIGVIEAAANAIDAFWFGPEGNILSVGGIEVLFTPGVLEQALRSPDGQYTSRGRAGSHVIPWIKWLLQAGQSVVIADHSVMFGVFPNSRSGRAIMRKGGGWAVPPEYAGDAADNFIRRTIEAIRPEVEALLEQITRRALR